MEKIYFNLKNENINFLEENEKTAYDILLSEMAGKIVLSSVNSIKSFDCFDPFSENKDTIKALIKAGYKPVSKFMENLLTQSYNICPNCGEDIDIERDCSVLITDAGQHLLNISNKKLSPAKELDCLNCGHIGLYYYDLYADVEEKKAFSNRALDSGSEIYVKYRYIIDGGKKNAWIPIVFDFTQFIQLFNNSDEDMFNELRKGNDNKIIRMLFNKELHKILDADGSELYNNFRVELKPIELGHYSKYVTRNDYNTIQLYKSIGDDQDKLLKLIVGDF